MKVVQREKGDRDTPLTTSLPKRLQQPELSWIQSLGYIWVQGPKPLTHPVAIVDRRSGAREGAEERGSGKDGSPSPTPERKAVVWAPQRTAAAGTITRPRAAASCCECKGRGPGGGGGGSSRVAVKNVSHERGSET